MTKFPKCMRCGYDPNPVYERALAAADKWLADTEEERQRFFRENFEKLKKEMEKEK